MKKLLIFLLLTSCISKQEEEKTAYANSNFEEGVSFGALYTLYKGSLPSWSTRRYAYKLEIYDFHSKQEVLEFDKLVDSLYKIDNPNVQRLK